MISLPLPSYSETSLTSSTPHIPSTTAKVKVLPNGLTIIVDEDHSTPVTSVQAWCNTGSIDEGKHLGAGLSHILEHMLFKGTKKRKAGEIASQIQDQGGYINAYTTFDRTVYWIDVPSTGASEALSILSDAMMNSTLPEEEYAKEQEVIRREFAMGFDDPGRMSSQTMFRTVFQESPYKYPVIGYLDIYNQLTRQDVMDYYKARYVPNNLTFVVVGDVDADQVFAQLEKEMGDYPRQTLEPVYIPTEPPQLGRREVHEEFPTELTRLLLSWPIHGIADKDTPALDVLAGVLGDGRSSPLYRELRDKQGIVYGISAGTYTPANAGVFVISTMNDPDKRSLVESEVLKIVEDIQKNGVAKESLEKIKKTMLSDQLHQLATMRGKASDLGSNWTLARNLNFSRDYLQVLEKLTTKDIQDVAKKYLKPDQLSVTSLNPIGSLKKEEKTEKTAKDETIQKFELPNGLRVLVKEDKRLPLVSMIAAFRGGLLAENKANNGITSLLSKAILKGTKTRTAEQIAEQIESVGGSISSSYGNNSFAVSVDVMKPDIKLGLELLADVLTQPTFPEKEVEREKQVQLAAIKSEQDQITTLARNLLRENLFGTHPYALRNAGTAESVNSLTPKDLKQLHDQLIQAKNGVVAIFGDVDAKEIKQLCKSVFSKLPEGVLAMTDAPKPTPLSQHKTVVENSDKQQAVVMVGYSGLSLNDPDLVTLELIESASSDLGSRFFNRIREKNALAYYVGASQFVGLVPGMFAFYLGTDPVKVERAQEELRDEIGKLAEEGLTDQELARAKKKVLGQDAISRQGNGAFASMVAVDELMGRGFNRYKSRSAEVNAVTREDTQRVAQRIFQSPGSVEAIVKPPTSVYNKPNP